ncbi:MAG: hypothetical protein R3E95_20095 [Thiolinea sp.]
MAISWVAGDSKGMLEHEMRNHHMDWIINAKTTQVEEGKMHVEEYNADGEVVKNHEINFDLAMMLPAFKGVDAVAAGRSRAIRVASYLSTNCIAIRPTKISTLPGSVLPFRRSKLRLSPQVHRKPVI